MKKIFGLTILLMLVIASSIFADDHYLIERYAERELGFDFCAQRIDENNCIYFGFLNCPAVKSSYSEKDLKTTCFLIYNSGWSDETVKKFMKKVYLEQLHDNGCFITHDILCSVFNTYINDFFPSMGYFGIRTDYKFELIDIIDNPKDNEFNYVYRLIVK